MRPQRPAANICNAAMRCILGLSHCVQLLQIYLTLCATVVLNAVTVVVVIAVATVVVVVIVAVVAENEATAVYRTVRYRVRISFKAPAISRTFARD